jgi:hypothetical protein
VTFEACDGVSDAFDGILTFTDLATGYYTLYHVSGPDGYLPYWTEMSIELGIGWPADYIAEVARPDTDGDGYADFYDNCPDVHNPDQVNTNETLAGDACDPVAEPVFEPRIWTA